MALLEAERLTKDFGGLRAVDDLGLQVQEGEIVGLIGPNGSGKTTVFNLITGIYSTTAAGSSSASPPIGSPASASLARSRTSASSIR